MKWALVGGLSYFLFLLGILVFFPVILQPKYFDIYGALDVAIFLSPYLLLASISQIAFLMVPVTVADPAPAGRRWLPWSIFASGFMVANLVFYLAFVIPDILALLWSWWLWMSVRWGDDIAVPLGLSFGTWGIWGYVFWQKSRSVPATDLIARQCRALLVGGLLGVLVSGYLSLAVWIRRRDPSMHESCAVGIFLGLSVLLFSVGPRLLSLCARRWGGGRPAVKDTPT
jgi:hypothetical protein